MHDTTGRQETTSQWKPLCTLADLATAHRLRVRRDPDDGTDIIRGKRGQIFEYSDTHFAVMLLLESARAWNNARKRLLAANCQIFQNGDTEGSASFLKSDVLAAKQAIREAKIRSKRHPSARQLEVLKAHSFAKAEAGNHERHSDICFCSECRGDAAPDEQLEVLKAHRFANSRRNGSDLRPPRQQDLRNHARCSMKASIGQSAGTRSTRGPGNGGNSGDPETGNAQLHEEAVHRLNLQFPHLGTNPQQRTQERTGIADRNAGPLKLQHHRDKDRNRQEAR